MLFTDSPPVLPGREEAGGGGRSRARDTRPGGLGRPPRLRSAVGARRAAVRTLRALPGHQGAPRARARLLRRVPACGPVHPSNNLGGPRCLHVCICVCISAGCVCGCPPLRRRPRSFGVGSLYRPRGGGERPRPRGRGGSRRAELRSARAGVDGPGARGACAGRPGRTSRGSVGAECSRREGAAPTKSRRWESGRAALRRAPRPAGALRPPHPHPHPGRLRGALWSLGPPCPPRSLRAAARGSQRSR